MDLSGFFWCKCGKMHTTSTVGSATVCPRCGERLFPQMMQCPLVG